jgi:hypothetical protein
LEVILKCEAEQAAALSAVIVSHFLFRNRTSPDEACVPRVTRCRLRRRVTIPWPPLRPTASFRRSSRWVA